MLVKRTQVVTSAESKKEKKGLTGKTEKESELIYDDKEHPIPIASEINLMYIDGVHYEPILPVKHEVVKPVVPEKILLFDDCKDIKENTAYMSLLVGYIKQQHGIDI